MKIYSNSESERTFLEKARRSIIYSYCCYKLLFTASSYTSSSQHSISNKIQSIFTIVSLTGQIKM